MTSLAVGPWPSSGPLREPKPRRSYNTSATSWLKGLQPARGTAALSLNAVPEEFTAMEYFLANRSSDSSPTSGLAGIQARLGVPAPSGPTPELRQFQAPRTEPVSPLERDVEELKASIYAIGMMLKTYFEIADVVTMPAQVMMVLPGAMEVTGGLGVEEAAALEREALARTSSRTANTLQDEMALQAAKEGTRAAD